MAATLDPHLQWDTDSYNVYRSKLTPEDVGFSVTRITDPALRSSQLSQFNQIAFAAVTGRETAEVLTPAKFGYSGDVPAWPYDPEPPGRRFHTRCPMAAAICSTEEPAWRAVGESLVACNFAG